ncbi:hypothetical protein SUGI_0402350 [Cryptomeria japonica]|nr:hypothetical protein SUGI_0402350 [Cryptomeria japonica]
MDNMSYGGYEIVEAHFLLGCGLAFAIKIKKVDGVLITSYDNGAPSVSSMIKKIKGHDGKKLDRIQDHIGMITSMVLSDKAISVAQSGNANLPCRGCGG